MKNSEFGQSWVGWFLMGLSLLYLVTVPMLTNIHAFPSGIVPIAMAVSSLIGARALVNQYEPEAILHVLFSAQGVIIALTGLSLLFEGLTLLMGEPWDTISSLMTLFWYLGVLSAALYAARWRAWV